MTNKKKEEMNGIDVDAEVAYQKATNQSCKYKMADNDNEFDYDANVFDNTCTNIVETDAMPCSINIEKLSEPSELSEIARAETDTTNLDSVNNSAEHNFSQQTYGVDTKVLHRGEISSEDGCHGNLADWKEEHEAATEEWSHVEEITAVEASGTTKPTCTPPISFSQALEHYESLNLSEYKTQIRPCIQRTGFASFCYSFLGSAALSNALVEERDFIFTLALVKFDNASEVSNQVLYTIYKGLTRSKVDCPRYGKHWESIGFQGNDPTTDLRGCGMLGLLTALHFITSKKTSELASSIYTLSQDEMQNFPYCVMSINVTRIALQVLREGKLNKECNKRYKVLKKASTYKVDNNTGVVYEVFQQIYASIFARIYSIWKNEYKTMADSGFVMKDVETLATKKPIELLKSLETTTATKVQSDDSDKMERFVGIDEL